MPGRGDGGEWPVGEWTFAAGGSIVGETRARTFYTVLPESGFHMARGYSDPNLPDGIVKLPPEPAEREGCGVRGCLYAVVALFALLLVAMVAIALFRVWQTPVVMP